MRVVALWLALVAVCAPCVAQDARVLGRVLGPSGEAGYGVVVKTSPETLGVYTDSAGAFAVAVAAGPVRVWAEGLFWGLLVDSDTVDLTIAPGDSARVALTLRYWEGERRTERRRCTAPPSPGVICLDPPPVPTPNVWSDSSGVAVLEEPREWDAFWSEYLHEYRGAGRTSPNPLVPGPVPEVDWTQYRLLIAIVPEVPMCQGPIVNRVEQRGDSLLVVLGPDVVGTEVCIVGSWRPPAIDLRLIPRSGEVYVRTADPGRYPSVGVIWPQSPS